MTETTTKISDYKDYDYKTDYWVNEDRNYENTVEQNTVERLVKSCKNRDTITDIGCGFGRLFPSYQPHTNTQILIDYTQHLLDQAKKELQNTQNTQFIQGNMYDLPLDDNSVDIALSIRTLHHLQTPNVFFNELHRILKPGGTAILEIPNKRNILTILRYLLGRSKFNPFSKEPYAHSDTFINFHPQSIISALNDAGFTLKKNRNTNFFRHPLFKKIIPNIVLVPLDRLFQITLSNLNLSPSILISVQSLKEKE